MKYYSADLLIPVDQAPIEQGYVAIDDFGVVHSVGKADSLSSVDVKHLPGLLMPGLVNAHCHLELSHLVGRVDTGTGLLPFLKKVVTLRDIELEEILHQVKVNDQYMYDRGIVAVGDISNAPHTYQTKEESSIQYYTFVEMFDFLQPTMTETTIAQYQEVYNLLSQTKKNQYSYVPHAPYTVTEDLFNQINKLNGGRGTVSVHNQETPPENELFEYGTGGFHDFYAQFGFTIDQNIVRNSTAIHYLIEQMDPNCKTLFVHNTLTTAEDLKAAMEWNSQTYWATCPNANLYIENRLPDYQVFLDNDAKVCIGTDSLTSNWQLDIWEEVKTIKRYKSYVDFNEIISWATINGAEALGLQDSLGTLSLGKAPGLVHVDMKFDSMNALQLEGTSARRVC